MTSPNHSDVFAAFIEADAALKQVPALKTEIETLQSQLRHKEAEAEHWRTTADRTADKNAEQYEHIRSLEVERDEYGFRAIDAEDKLEKLSSLAGTVLASIKSAAPGGLSSKAEIEAHVPAGVSSEVPAASEARTDQDLEDRNFLEGRSSVYGTQPNDGLSGEGKSQSTGDAMIQPHDSGAAISSGASITNDVTTVDSQRDISPTASADGQSTNATGSNAEAKPSVDMSTSDKPYAGMLYRDWLSGWNNLGQVTYDDFVKGGGNYSAYIDDHMHDTL